MGLLLKNTTILTMREDMKPFEGDILIEGQHITQIGEIDMSCAESDLEVMNCKGMVAMPGLVNTHNHTPMSLLRSFSDDLRLMEWLNHKMLPAEANMNREDIYWGAQLGIAEMIKSGTTSFADMYIEMDMIAQAVQEVGIRASLTRGLVFLEDDGGMRVREGLDLIDKWTGKAEGRITTMLGPHAPYTCPPEPLSEIIQIARQRDIPIHIHLAESREEVLMMQDKYNKTPTQYLYDLGLFDGSIHALLAHAVHLHEEDIKLLRNNKGGIAHNPTSNLKLGCGIAPVKSYRENGVRVGLGTDGAGSATSLDLFKEICAVSCLQKAAHFDPAVLSAEAALKMATIEGSRLLRIDAEVGTLEVGKKADVILVDINKPHLLPHHNVVSLLAYSANGSDVDTTIVNGKVLMKNRELLTIDEERLFSEVRERAERIVQGV